MSIKKIALAALLLASFSMVGCQKPAVSGQYPEGSCPPAAECWKALGISRGYAYD
jgi:hypothetical protein